MQIHIIRAPALTGVIALLCYPGANLTVGKEGRHNFFKSRCLLSDGSSSSLSLSLALSLSVYVCVCVSTIVSAQTTMRINFKMSQGHWRHISQVTSCRFFRGFSHVSKQSRLFLTKSTFNHNWQTTEDQVSVTVKIQISILENIHYLKIFWTIKINLIPKMSSSKHFS